MSDINDIDGWDDIEGGLDPTCFMDKGEFDSHAQTIRNWVRDDAFNTKDARFLKQFIVRVLVATGPHAREDVLAAGMYGITMAACGIGYQRAKEAYVAQTTE